MYRLLSLTAAATLVSIAAMAASPYSATLSQALSAPKDVIAGQTMWHCEGTSCVTRSNPYDAGTTGSCHKLMSQVGTLSAYGRADKPFDEESLKECNEQ